MYSSPRDILGFNAARGFVGGATARRRRSQKAILVSMPHAALWVVQRSWERSRLVAQSGFNAARGFVGGATVPICAFGLARCSFNAARGFVGGATPILMAQMKALTCFNAARGFVGGATARRRKSEPVIQVSMPHAALWVVQLPLEGFEEFQVRGFNAARGFVGGATIR